MAYHIFEKLREFPLAFLVKKIDVQMFKTAYLKEGLFKPEDIIVFDLMQAEYRKKLSVNVQREFLEKEIFPKLEKINTEIIVLTDATYFTALTKLSKATKYTGTIVDSIHPSFKVVYLPSTEGYWYDPDNINKDITLGSSVIYRALKGDFSPIGEGIIHNAKYPDTFTQIIECLKELKYEPELTVDVETKSLKHPDAGIGTITLCKNKHEGVAFGVDYQESKKEFILNPAVRMILKAFFKNYKGKLIFHNACFDVYILVYQLFMSHLRDFEGMYEGLAYFLRDFDDTQIMAYLATNSTLGNKLSLKENAREYTGVYALENIEDITQYDLPIVLKYNLIDGLATFFVRDKYAPIIKRDEQTFIYEQIFKPAVRDFIVMQLVGLPIKPDKVIEVESMLIKEVERVHTVLEANPIIQEFLDLQRERIAKQSNAKWKTKSITAEEVETELNLNSSNQLQVLFYDLMGLPVIDTTKTGNPAVGGNTIKKLLNICVNEEHKEALKAILDYSDCKVILGTFIPAFKKTYADNDGNHWMFGSLKLGGCVSGRVTASNPNILALPSGSKYGKAVKEIFQPPKGWLLVGSDFSSLISSDFIQ